MSNPVTSGTTMRKTFIIFRAHGMGWLDTTAGNETLTVHARFQLHACRLHRCTVVTSIGMEVTSLTVVTPIGMVATSLTVVAPIGKAVTSQAAVTALAVTSLHACQRWACARPYSMLT